MEHGILLNRAKAAMGRAIAHYLTKKRTGYETFSALSSDRIRRALRPGDVLLVEGNTRISAAIKYVTHSTWSHAAFFAGSDRPGEELIEADLEAGVIAVPITKYAELNTRICRPIGLTDADLAELIGFMRASLGKTYDLRNVIDLARYLLPQPPVPARFRRRLLALGSGDPTRAICSTLIAQAFQSLRYPILPDIRPGCPENCAREILHIRHHSLFTPRDFDLSPYFRVVKPTIEDGFDHRSLTWGEAPLPDGSPDSPPAAEHMG